MSLLIPLGAVTALAVWTGYKFPKATDLGPNAPERAKLRESLIFDIRAANQYCMAYIALLGVLATIVAAHTTPFERILNTVHLWPFAVAFVAAAFSILFIPAGYGSPEFLVLRCLWVRTLLCEQVVVVLTCYGIWDTFVVLIQQSTSSVP